MIANKLQIKNVETIDEVLEQTGMNWIADQQELITAAGINVHSHKAIIREDNKSVLGIVGKGYEPVQNSTAFAFMDTLVQDHKATFEYLYEIDGGSKTIVQARIGDSFEVREGDKVQSYLTMINSFNGTTPFTVYFTPIRLWCANQLGGSLKAAQNKVTLRHSKNIMGRAEEAFKILGKANNYFKMFKDKSRELAQKAIDSKMVDNFLKDLMGEPESTRKENQFEDIINHIESGMGNNGSSLWDVYNGVTEWVDHSKIKNDNKRLASALVGSGSKLKEAAWATSLKYLDM